MKKSLVFTVVLILSIFSVKSYYNARCMDKNFDYSVLTVSGVYCKKEGTFIAPYERLDSFNKEDLYYFKELST